MTARPAWFRPLDAAVYLGLVIASGACFLAFKAVPGSRAAFHVGDRKVAWYDLAGPERSVEIPTAIGPVQARVGNGSVQVTESPCPNKRCVHTGAVRRAHGEIACAPARLLIVVEGGETSSTEGPDAITF